jgi:hypothetical protein
MPKKRKFVQEFISTAINGGISLIENPVISSRPNTPGHKDNDFHEERSSKMSSYLVDDGWDTSGGSKRNAD